MGLSLCKHLYYLIFTHFALIIKKYYNKSCKLIYQEEKSTKTNDQ